MRETLKTREFWMVVIGAAAAICKALNVPMVDGLIQQYGPIWAGILATLVAGKALKTGQTPFVPAPPVAMLAALLGLFLMAPAPARAADLSDVVGIFGAVNGSWSESASDVEAGGTARASLSPHLSAVGGAVYGFDGSYVRWSVGGRFTATDVDDPSFSVGLGIQYHGASEPISGPYKEWAPDASFGWVPFAERPRLSVVGLASYGLTSESARASLGLRYKFNL